MAPRKKVVDEAALKRCEDSKNQLVSQYLHLGSAMKRCSVAVEAYATALNDASTNEEMLALLRAPPTGPMPAAMPGMMPFLSTKQEEEDRAVHDQLINPGGGAAKSKKRSNSEENSGAGEGEAEAEGGAKKKRKSKKKEVDPNAPKRPPSAYIVYQNEVRADVRAQHPDLKYPEILTLIGDNWKGLGEEGQAKYKEKAIKAMDNWKSDTLEYAASGGKAENGDTSMADAAPTSAAPKAKAPKKEKKAKEAPAASTPAEKPASAKAKTPAAITSTPAKGAAAAAKPAPTSTKKNVPQAAPESSDSDSSDDSSSDDESDE